MDIKARAAVGVTKKLTKMTNPREEHPQTLIKHMSFKILQSKPT